MYVIFSKDNSIYFDFPSKNNRCISKFKERKYINKEYCERKVKLKKYKPLIVQSKISFHPRDMILHINSNISRRTTDDYEVLNVSPVDNELMAYVLQIIFTNNENFYDEYNKTKYNDYIVVNNLNDNLLSVEFIIHSKNINPTIESLPFSKNRNFQFGYTFDSPYKYTYSVFVSTLSESKIDNILINVNSKNRNYIYTIDNKDNKCSNIFNKIRTFFKIK